MGLLPRKGGWKMWKEMGRALDRLEGPADNLGSFSRGCRWSAAQSADAVAVGAGVVDCSVPYYLAQRGAAVINLEREAMFCEAPKAPVKMASLLPQQFVQPATPDFHGSGINV